MSLDLFQNEAVNRLSNLPPVKVPAPSTFQGFASGTGAYAMRSLASVGRAVDMAGAVGPIIQDAFTGGTVAQERYFKEHDDFFNSAVDYWTPRPSDVGAAGQVAGQLLGNLGIALASPELAVLGAGFGTAEDAVKNGASADQAVGAGMVQGATAGLGMWMPILGSTGWQRIAVGGALGNTALGAASRGATGAILEGTPAAEQFRAFDPTSLTLDTLMGAAFGTMAHLNPAQRAQGAQAWKTIGEWAQGMRASDRDAIATLRLGQHINVDSAPGHLDTPQAIDAHVTRMRTALDQILRDEPVELSNLPFPRTTPDETRVADMFTRAEALRREGNDYANTLGLPRIAPTEAEMMTLARDRLASNVEPDLISQAGAGDVEQISSLKASVADLEQRITNVTQNRDASLQDLTRQFQDSGMKFKAARDRAAKELDNQLADLQAMHERQSTQLETAGRAELARQDLDALSKGRIPERLQAAFDEILGSTQRSFRPSPISEIVKNALSEMGSREQPSAQHAGAPTEAQPVPAAPPSPPPGEAKPAGASAQPDLLAQEAQRIVTARPDAVITTGRNPDGTPISTTVSQYLHDTLADVALAREQSSLFEVAATCMIGKM
jgi:hypothetical protein